jgi:DNA-binding NtrC family response regulator
MEDNQPWVTCYLTDILISYMKEEMGVAKLDYPGLFRGSEGFETPPDPEWFLTEVNNWVPLTVLRELEAQCEKISGKKDVAYHAARVYFDPDKKQLPSLFEIIVHVLNDVRSALILANLWAAAQTNYLKLQSFDKVTTIGGLYMLAQFDENGRPGVGAVNLLRGFCEGFSRLYRFIDEIRCVEEISQLPMECIAQEFPDFALTNEGDRLTIRDRSSRMSVEAIRVPLRSESITLSHEFLQNTPDAVVAPSRDGRIEVLTDQVDTDHRQEGNTPFAYQVVIPGVITQGPLSYSFHKGQIFNAPYSRFRIEWKERPRSQKESPDDGLRREVSQLLFDHLKQIKETHMRMVQFNIERRRLTLENLRLKREIEREYSFAGIIGRNEKMQDLFGLVRSIAETDMTVLIQGETGTGKELIAKAIHYNSPRKANRFLAINCGALSETLLESELFGHEKGAFTGATAQRKGIFEAAHGGTLLLDEVGEVTPSTQVKLLRVLQEGEFQRVGGRDPIKVDVRLISATNQILECLVENGRFRQDLFYRLNVFPMTVPPLRERADDVPLLVSHIIEKTKQSVNKRISGISPQALASLMTHSWPGNVRELENMVQRMMVVCKGEILDVHDLPGEIRGKEGRPPETARTLKGISKESAGIIEKKAILDALSQTGGNVTRAARSLGVSRATLQNKMKTYGLRDQKN